MIGLQFTVYSLQMITLTDQKGLPANHLYARLCRLLPQGRKNLNRPLDPKGRFPQKEL